MSFFVLVIVIATASGGSELLLGHGRGAKLVLEQCDQVTDDGIIALHISNRVYRLEPVVAAIAEELRLAGRVWNDEYDNRPGKTWSSWVQHSLTS